MRDDDARIDRQIDEMESILKVGDVVVEVRGDEFDGMTSFGWSLLAIPSGSDDPSEHP